jgi:transketolase
MTTGSLGQGISNAVGMAIASKIKEDGARIYCFIGDGESQEGQVWEAAMTGAHFGLNNLIVFTDYNKLQIDGSIEQVMGLEPLGSKWADFGWNVINVIDGHSITEIYEAVESAKKSTDKPTMIILNTIKGKGVSFVEAMKESNHNMPITEEQRLQALKELE